MNFALKILVPTAIGVGVKLYNEWKRKEELKRIRATMVEVVNTPIDPDEPSELALVETKTKKLKKRLRYHGLGAIIKAVQHVEVQVGILKNTTANRMVVDKLVRDFMRKPVSEGGLGMRNCHIVRDYGVAVSMYFKPRAARVILDVVDSIEVDEFTEAKRILGLDGSL